MGESWEISGVPGHESVAINRGLVNDVDEGLTLVELIDKYKELLVGKKIYKKFGNQFPLVVYHQERCGLEDLFRSEKEHHTRGV